MTSLAQDLRYALRQLGKSPGFTLVALATLALGIGANTGIFTLVNAVMLKSLPVRNPEQLFLVIENDFEPQNTRFSYPFFQQARAAVPQGSQLAAASWPGRFYAAFAGQAEMVTGQLVSGNYFQTLQTYAELGRLINDGDDRAAGASPVAVISYGCWERRFGRDPNVIGRKLVVNGMPIQIVGVAAERFFGTRAGAAPEFWLPTSMQSAVRYQQHYSNDTSADSEVPWVSLPGVRWLQFVFRANDPRRVASASAALNQVFHLNRMQAAAGKSDPAERESILRQQLRMVPGARGLPNLEETFSKPLLALMAMVGIILLIACANLANLLLARAAAREREIAVRLSLGATRSRLVRQLLVECVLLSFCGAACGGAIAYWLTSVLHQWASGGSTTIPVNLNPDARVLLFSITVAVVTGIAFGLAPALQGFRVEPIHALKSGARTAEGGGTRWSVKQGLVTAQIALSLVLLVGAGLFVRTLRNYSTLDPGFERDRLITVDLDTHLAGYSPAGLTSLYRTLIDRIEAISGVRSASLLSCEIASGCRDASDIFLPGVPHSNGETDAQERFVSHDFFATTAIPLVRGRLFADSDTDKSPKVAIVNQTFVRQFLPGKDPIGQYFGYDAANPRQFQIVGVVKDSRFNDIREPVPPTIFHSLGQDSIDIGSLNVRTFADPAPLVAEIREAVRSVDPKLPISGSSTVADVVSEGLWGYRLIARLASIFGAVALGLACLGLYGVLSYTVARRRAELGVRFALGATRGAVLWLVVQQTLVMAAAGIAAGLLLSFAAGRTVSSLLFGLSPHDPATIFAAAFALLAVSIASGLIPALRAARVNPNDALRAE
jgi:predicted permease